MYVCNLLYSNKLFIWCERNVDSPGLSRVFLGKNGLPCGVLAWKYLFLCASSFAITLYIMCGRGRAGGLWVNGVKVGGGISKLSPPPLTSL